MNQAEKHVADHIERIVRAMIECHDQLTFTADNRHGCLFISITANVADAKRIVGKDGRHISALLCVAWIIGRQLGVSKIAFDRITVTEMAEHSFEKYVPVKGADLEPACSLVGEIVQVLGGHVVIDEHKRGDMASSVIVTTTVPHCGEIENLSNALHTLFVPIGMKLGRIMHVTIDGSGADDWRQAYAARRAARCVHVPGSKPDQRSPEVPGEHRGQLGERNVHVHGFRGAEKPGAAGEWSPSRTS